jgi:tRNA pseudouridine13 synthase
MASPVLMNPPAADRAERLPAPRPLPYGTPGLAGCGGTIKAVPEDFVVDEIPSYAPAGRGEHVYLRIWKRGLSTRVLAQRLSHATGVPP